MKYIYFITRIIDTGFLSKEGKSERIPVLEDEGRFFLEFRFFWCGSNSVYFGVLERFVKGVSYDVSFALAQIMCRLVLLEFCFVSHDAKIIGVESCYTPDSTVSDSKQI